MVPAMLFAPRFDGRGIVSRLALRRIWAEHRSGRRDHASQLWSLLMLEFWFRRCMDSECRRRTARIRRAEGGGLTCAELRDSPRQASLDLTSATARR